MQLKNSAASGLKKIFYKVSKKYSAKLSGSNSLLYNKFVLYASFIISLLTLLMWAMSGHFIPIVVFLLAGYLTSFFSKNMIVILVIAFVVSNVVKSGSSIALEGMNNPESDEEKPEGVENKEEEEKEEKEGLPEKHASKKHTDGLTTQKEYSQESEGLEGEDENKTPCMVDKDCESGYKCDNYRCVSVK